MICQKFETAQQISNLPGRGRKRAATVRKDELIIHGVKKNSNTAISEIEDQLIFEYVHKNISPKIARKTFV